MGIFSRKKKIEKDFVIDRKNIRKLLVWKGPDGCVATDRILVDGCRVGYMFREEPVNESDSGWRFFEGSETRDYTDDPARSGVYKLNTVCNYDKDIIPYLSAPFGSAFIRDGENGFVEERQELREAE